MNGEKGVVTPTFVKSPLYEDQGIEYFSSNVELGVSRGVSLLSFYHHLRFERWWCREWCQGLEEFG